MLFVCSHSGHLIKKLFLSGSLNPSQIKNYTEGQNKQTDIEIYRENGPRGQFSKKFILQKYKTKNHKK